VPALADHTGCMVLARRGRPLRPLLFILPLIARRKGERAKKTRAFHTPTLPPARAAAVRTAKLPLPANSCRFLLPPADSCSLCRLRNTTAHVL
jgi:hypothetical protein